jgi:hypothetical protein
MANISNNIKDKEYNSERLIIKWNNIIDILKTSNKLETITVSSVISEKYRFDLEGMFKNELNIKEEHIYPNIRINGYDSSNTYEGNKIEFKLLDPILLDRYYNLFIN